MTKNKVVHVILLAVALLLLIFFAANIRSGEVSSKDDLSVIEKNKINKIVKEEDPATTAEMINGITDEVVSDIATTEVLNDYFTEETVDTDAVNEFSETLNSDIEETVDNYTEAREERDNQDNLEYQTGEIIISVDPETPEEDINSMVQEVSDSYEIVDDGIVKVNLGLDQSTQRAMEQFEQYDIVEETDTNNLGTLDALSSTLSDRRASYEWYLDDCDFELAWRLVKQNPHQKVKVAVIDDAFNTTHRDLINMIVDTVDVTETNEAGEYKNLTYGNWEGLSIPYHGSCTSSMLAGEVNNCEVAGVGGTTDNLVELMLIKVYDSNNSVSSAGFYKAVKYAVDNGAKVISCSISWSSSDMTLKKACDYAEENGVTLVCSAGNEDTDDYRYPSGYDTVISVGATDQNDEKAYFSTYGQTVNIVAPGVSIWGAGVESDTEAHCGSGTSYSTPIVAGAAALMLEVNPDLTPTQIRQMLYETSTDIGEHRWYSTKSVKNRYCYMCGEKSTIKIFKCSDCDAVKWEASDGHAHYEDDSFGCGLLNAGSAVKEALNEKNN